MAGLYNIEAEYDDLAARNPYTEADTPTSGGAGWRAQLNLFVREETFISESLNYGQMMNNRAKIIGQLGGNEELAGIYGSSMPAYHMQRLRKLEQNGLLEDSPEWHATPEHIRESYRHVREMEDRYPDQVLSDEALDEERNANFASWRSVEEDIIRRAPWYASFLGAMQGAVTDPLVVATMPFGGALAKSGTTALKTGLRFAAIESAIAVGTEIPIQAAVYKYKRKLDAPWGFADSAMNVLAAGAGGAVLGGLMGAGGQAGRNYMDARKLLKATEEIRRQMDSAAIVLNRAEVEALETLEATARIDAMNPLVDPGPARVGANKTDIVENLEKIKAGDIVEDLEILGDVPNQESIRATYNDGEFEIIGLRAVPIEHLGEADPKLPPPDELAQEIASNKVIKPLIVVYENTGPYILEGAHRIDSLDQLGKKKIPAFVVDARTEIPTENPFNFANATEAYHYALEVSRLQDEAGLPVDVEDVVKDFQEEMVTIWHGGPHEYDSFDISKIGTGEGAQAYGWGLYFAESPGVAKSYQAQVKDVRSIRELEELAKPGGELDSSINRLRTEQRYWADKNPTKSAEAAAEADELTRQYREIVAGHYDKVHNPGHIYEVNIPKSAIDNMLDWDKPLSEQPEVMKAIKELSWLDDPKTVAHKNGEWLYREISEGSTDKETSKWLNEAGIPGIKFLDGTSRSAGEGTRNFVIFDDQLPVIVKRNEQPIKAPKPEPVGKGANITKVVEDGAEFETGKAVTFKYVRNKESAPDAGKLYQQDIEPTGKYVTHGADAPEGWESGTVTLNNPLVIQASKTGEVNYGVDSWKATLSKLYDGKAGGELSNAIKADGYDGIVTVTKTKRGAQTAEIVLLQDAPKAKPEAKPAVVIENPPRSIVKKMAVEPADPNASSRTGIVSDDDYMAVLEEWKRLSEDGDAKLEVTTEIDGEMVIRNVNDVVEELETLDNTLNDLRLCSLGGGE